MLRFIGRRILFIILVWVFIVFFAHLGMRMARNSEISRLDYNQLLTVGEGERREMHHRARVVTCKGNI